MFIGKYYHTLEAKGRVSLPVAFRKNHEDWVVTRGLDGGLFLLPETTFVTEVEQLSQRPFTQKRNRDFVRLLTNEAQQVRPDAQGRIQLPEYLIEQAHLEKAIVLVGSMSRVEIWNRELYHEYVDSLEASAVEIAESIHE